MGADYEGGGVVTIDIDGKEAEGKIALEATAIGAENGKIGATGDEKPVSGEGAFYWEISWALTAR